MKRRNFLMLLPAMTVLKALPLRKAMEIQSISQVVGGTFKMHACGKTFGPFDWNATSEEINRVTEPYGLTVNRVG